MGNINIPKTLLECSRYFSDPDVCVEFLAAMRWKQGVECPHCKSKRHSYLKTRRIWKCSECKKQFSAKVGTVFEDSPVPLDKWMMVVWLVVNCKNGVSSWEIHRHLKVTQKTAWFMLHRVRLALKNNSDLLLGGQGTEVEVDESFVGGKVINMHRSRAQKFGGGISGKTAVQGILDRSLREVRATVVPNTKRETLQNLVLNNIRRGSTVYSDEVVAYDKLGGETTSCMKWLTILRSMFVVAYTPTA